MKQYLQGALYRGLFTLSLLLVLGVAVGSVALVLQGLLLVIDYPLVALGVIIALITFVPWSKFEYGYLSKN